MKWHRSKNGWPAGQNRKKFLWVHQAFGFGFGEFLDDDNKMLFTNGIFLETDDNFYWISLSDIPLPKKIKWERNKQ